MDADTAEGAAPSSQPLAPPSLVTHGPSPALLSLPELILVERGVPRCGTPTHTPGGDASLLEKSPLGGRSAGGWSTGPGVSCPLSSLYLATDFLFFFFLSPAPSAAVLELTRSSWLNPTLPEWLGRC